jgi:hypothetical protein
MGASETETKIVQVHFRRSDQAAPSGKTTPIVICKPGRDSRSREANDRSVTGESTCGAGVEAIARWAKGALPQFIFYRNSQLAKYGPGNGNSYA